MSYVPSYPKEKLEVLRRYVLAYKTRQEKKAASVISEEYSSRISKAPTDGDARYKYFNNLFFNGNLPNVKVYFLDSNKRQRNSTGFTKKSRIGYDDISSNENYYGCWYPELKAIYIFIDRLGYSDFEIDSILVHEMCHVWQDKVYKGINNSSPHSSAFQLVRNRVKKKSNNIYDVGAYSDADERSEKFNSGWYGNPAVGKSSEELKKHYKSRIDSFSKESGHGNWRVIDLDNRIFQYLDKASMKVRFSNGKFKGSDKVTSTIANRLNGDEDYVNGLSERFEQIRKKKGF